MRQARFADGSFMRCSVDARDRIARDAPFCRARRDGPRRANVVRCRARPASRAVPTDFTDARRARAPTVRAKANALFLRADVFAARLLLLGTAHSNTVHAGGGCCIEAENGYAGADALTRRYRSAYCDAVASALAARARGRRAAANRRRSKLPQGSDRDARRAGSRARRRPQPEVIIGAAPAAESVPSARD